MSYVATDLSKPKFFDDNLLLSADTITEPTAAMGTSDLPEYFKDNRNETYITLTDVADHVFIYEFNNAQPLNLFQIKNCNAHDYLVEVDEGAGYATLISGTFTSAVDTVTSYTKTTKNVIKIKITLSHENYSSIDSVVVGGILACGQIFEFVADARYYPSILVDSSKEQNWLGAKMINKTRTWFECNIKIDAFTTAAQADITFLDALQQRNTPFYIWLNGNRADNTFAAMAETWKFNNLYRVYDDTTTIAMGHENAQNETGNPIVGRTMTLVEAAFIEEL